MIVGTTIVGLASVLVPGAIEFGKFQFIEKRKAAELTISQTANQQKYVSDYLTTGLNQDIELRIRFANYLAHVSADDYKEDWQAYLLSLRGTRDSNRSEINKRGARLWSLLKLNQLSTEQEIEAEQLKRELRWLYDEIGYVAQKRIVVPSEDDNSSEQVTLPLWPTASGLPDRTPLCAV